MPSFAFLVRTVSEMFTKQDFKIILSLQLLANGVKIFKKKCVFGRPKKKLRNLRPNFESLALIVFVLWAKQISGDLFESEDGTARGTEHCFHVEFQGN